jgi:hypothetical protein
MAQAEEDEVVDEVAVLLCFFTRNFTVTVLLSPSCAQIDLRISTADVNISRRQSGADYVLLE